MKVLPNDPVIVSFARTPFGRYGGVLRFSRPDDLLAHCLSACLKRADLKSEQDHIDEVIVGAANQAGEDNRNVARMAALLSGLSHSIPAITINRLCASGMDAVIEGARRIITGEQRLVLAAGVESMSRAPYVMAKSSKAFSIDPPAIFDTSLGWRFYNEKLLNKALPESNGLTVERLCDIYHIDRNAQDIFSLNSHLKALRAQKTGFFNTEIEPIKIKIDNEELILKKDEGPRTSISIESLAKLKPAFKKNGLLTAGNSSFLSDGAASILLSSFQYARDNRLPILGRILGFASHGVDPSLMGIGPVYSTKKLCEKFGFSLKDFDLFEINEAFSAQVLAVIKELNIDHDLVNTNGGAIALGHPLGASGNRLVMTMINNLKEQKKQFGLACLCVGVGQGVSIAIECL